MPLAVNAFESAAVDKRRLLEDMGKTVQVFRESQERGRPLYPTTAALRELGDLFLSGQLMGEFLPGSDLNRIVDAWHFPVFFGTVQVSYFLMAIIIACRDYWSEESDRLDLERGVRWLVLEGIHQLRLWPFLSREFVRQVRAPVIHGRSSSVSPLELCAMLDDRGASWGLESTADAEWRDDFIKWLFASRSDGRNFFWALTLEELRRQSGVSSRPKTMQLPESPSRAAESKLPALSRGVRRHGYPDLGDNYYTRRLALRKRTIEQSSGPEAGRIMPFECVSADLPVLTPQGLTIIAEFEACDPDLRSGLVVKFNLDAQFETTVPYPEQAGLPLFIPVILRQPARRIEVNFLANTSLDTAVHASDYPPRVRSLTIWRP